MMIYGTLGCWCGGRQTKSQLYSATSVRVSPKSDEKLLMRDCEMLVNIFIVNIEQVS